MIRHMLLTALMLSLAPMAALAQVPQSSPFDGADANRDGRISKDEFVAARSARFDAIDKNHDGSINRADFPRAANHQQALAKIDAHIAAADTNKDGSISRDELRASSTPFFDRADANKDGYVTQAEIAAMRSAAAAKRS